MSKLKESCDTYITRVATLMNQPMEKMSSEDFKVLKESYARLVALLNQASESYYSGKDSGLTDSEFDTYIQFLKGLEDSNKVIIDVNSPTQKVNGGSPDDKIKHIIPMLSLNDLFNRDDLASWLRGRHSSRFTVEPKIDGLSVELWYNHGALQQAVTRGNGIQGEDVTANAREIESIPKFIPCTDLLVVRGEVYMAKDSFNKYKAEFDPKAKNARNTAVGLFKRKDGGKAAGRFLDCWIFSVQGFDSSGALAAIAYEGGLLSYIAKLGFKVIPFIMCSTVEDVLAAVDKYAIERDNLPFQIDGAVIKEDSLDARKTAGDNGVVPRWAVAYKYPAKEATTTVIDIAFQLGKSGRITPVAILNPVEVDGSTVARCTLHNKNRMQELDIRIGDTVTLHKAGDIIPKITTATHTPSSQAFFFPTQCPVCKSKLDEDKCINDACPDKLLSKLYLWAGKEGLDIKGMSGALVGQLIDAKLLKTPADYYKITPAHLHRLPKMGPTKIKNILTAINNTKKRTFPEVIVALGINGLGWSAACKLVTHVRTWDQLKRVTREQCTTWLSNAVGDALYRALQMPYYQNLIDELKVIFPFDS